VTADAAVACDAGSTAIADAENTNKEIASAPITASTRWRRDIRTSV
jgi:hypothetical protein